MSKAVSVTYKHCGKKGHFAGVWNSKQSRNRQGITEANVVQTSETAATPNAVVAKWQPKKHLLPMPLMEVLVSLYSVEHTPSGQQVPSFEHSAMPDIDANKSMILVEYLELNYIAFQTSKSSRGRQITVANSCSFPCLGEIDLALTFEGRATPVDFLVCSNYTDLACKECG